MGKTFPEIDDKLSQLIERQHMYFVATAPLSGDGLVNLSPKGLDSFRILGPKRVAYADLVGSGAETIAHLRENGRITIMFCTFDGPPKILRLYGQGRAVEPGDEEFDELAALFPTYRSLRSVIVVDCQRIADSCGFAVPKMAFEGDRSQLTDWADRKSDAQIESYKVENNRESLDGLPALRNASTPSPAAS